MEFSSDERVENFEEYFDKKIKKLYLYINHDNRAAVSDRWVMVWSISTLLRSAWFLASLTDWISWWNSNLTIFCKFIPQAEVKTAHIDTKIWNFASFVPPLKYFHVNCVKNYNNLLKINYQHCNGCIKYDSKCAETL